MGSLLLPHSGSYGAGRSPYRGARTLGARALAMVGDSKMISCSYRTFCRILLAIAPFGLYALVEWIGRKL